MYIIEDESELSEDYDSEEGPKTKKFKDGDIIVEKKTKGLGSGTLCFW